MPERGRDDVVVFAGPSLPAQPDAAWSALLSHVRVLPPARRGDVLDAMARFGPRAIALIDGYYYTVPAVTHKELLYALDAGVHVVGGASMGALRAVELAPFGMRGAGEVYAAFRDGRLEGDDEVAVLHAPAELGYRAVTVALVEIRAALQAVMADVGCGRGAECGPPGVLIEAFKATCFTERTPGRVAELATEILPAAVAEQLRRRLDGDSTLKVRDAREVLEAAIAAGQAARPARVTTAARADVTATAGPEEAAASAPAPPRPPTGYLKRFLERALRVDVGEHEQAPSLDEAWKSAQVLHPETPALVRELRIRHLLAAAAEREHLAADAAGVRAVAARLRESHRQRFGRPVMPAIEYDLEAGIELGAAQAVAELGGRDAALSKLADRLCLPAADPEAALLHLLDNQPDQLPNWRLVRAFATTEALASALRVAACALELQLLYRDHVRGAPLRQEQLLGLAAELWECDADTVLELASRRALFLGAGITAPLMDALELVAVAERMPEPVNEYAEAKQALLQVPLILRRTPPGIVGRAVPEEAR